MSNKKRTDIKSLSELTGSRETGTLEPVDRLAVAQAGKKEVTVQFVTEGEYYMTQRWRDNPKTFKIDESIDDWMEGVVAEWQAAYRTSKGAKAPTKVDLVHYALGQLREMWGDPEAKRKAETWCVERRRLIKEKRYDDASKNVKEAWRRKRKERGGAREGGEEASDA